MKVHIYVAMLALGLCVKLDAMVTLDPNQGISNFLVSSATDEAKKESLFVFYKRYKNDSKIFTGALKKKLASFFGVPANDTDFDAKVEAGFLDSMKIKGGSKDAPANLPTDTAASIAAVSGKSGEQAKTAVAKVAADMKKDIVAPLAQALDAKEKGLAKKFFDDLTAGIK